MSRGRHEEDAIDPDVRLAPGDLLCLQIKEEDPDPWLSVVLAVDGGGYTELELPTEDEPGFKIRSSRSRAALERELSDPASMFSQLLHADRSSRETRRVGGEGPMNSGQRRPAAYVRRRRTLGFAEGQLWELRYAIDDPEPWTYLVVATFEQVAMLLRLSDGSKFGEAGTLYRTNRVDSERTGWRRL